MPNKYRIVKQNVTGSNPLHHRVFTARPSGSTEQIWEFDDEHEAYWKMMQLSGSDSEGKKYKVIEL